MASAWERHGNYVANSWWFSTGKVHLYLGTEGVIIMYDLMNLGEKWALSSFAEF
jgi:hypothetical protein